MFNVVNSFFKKIKGPKLDRVTSPAGSVRGNTDTELLASTTDAEQPALARSSSVSQQGGAAIEQSAGLWGLTKKAINYRSKQKADKADQLKNNLNNFEFSTNETIHTRQITTLANTKFDVIQKAFGADLNKENISNLLTTLIQDNFTNKPDNQLEFLEHSAETYESGTNQTERKKKPAFEAIIKLQHLTNADSSRKTAIKNLAEPMIIQGLEKLTTEQSKENLNILLNAMEKTGFVPSDDDTVKKNIGTLIGKLKTDYITSKGSLGFLEHSNKHSKNESKDKDFEAIIQLQSLLSPPTDGKTPRGTAINALAKDVIINELKELKLETDRKILLKAIANTTFDMADAIKKNLELDKGFIKEIIADSTQYKTQKNIFQKGSKQIKKAFNNQDAGLKLSADTTKEHLVKEFAKLKWVKNNPSSDIENDATIEALKDYAEKSWKKQQNRPALTADHFNDLFNTPVTDLDGHTDAQDDLKPAVDILNHTNIKTFAKANLRGMTAKSFRDIVNIMNSNTFTDTRNALVNFVATHDPENKIDKKSGSLSDKQKNVVIARKALLKMGLLSEMKAHDSFHIGEGENKTLKSDNDLTIAINTFLNALDDGTLKDNDGKSILKKSLKDKIKEDVDAKVEAEKIAQAALQAENAEKIAQAQNLSDTQPRPADKDTFNFLLDNDNNNKEIQGKIREFLLLSEPKYKTRESITIDQSNALTAQVEAIFSGNDKLTPKNIKDLFEQLIKNDTQPRIACNFLKMISNYGNITESDKIKLNTLIDNHVDISQIQTIDKDLEPDAEESARKEAIRFQAIKKIKNVTQDNPIILFFGSNLSTESKAMGHYTSGLWQKDGNQYKLTVSDSMISNDKEYTVKEAQKESLINTLLALEPYDANEILKGYPSKVVEGKPKQKNNLCGLMSVMRPLMNAGVDIENILYKTAGIDPNDYLINNTPQAPDKPVTPLAAPPTPRTAPPTAPAAPPTAPPTPTLTIKSLSKEIVTGDTGLIGIFKSIAKFFGKNNDNKTDTSKLAEKYEDLENNPRLIAHNRHVAIKNAGNTLFALSMNDVGNYKHLAGGLYNYNELSNAGKPNLMTMSFMDKDGVAQNITEKTKNKLLANQNVINFLNQSKDNIDCNALLTALKRPDEQGGIDLDDTVTDINFMNIHLDKLKATDTFVHILPENHGDIKNINTFITELNKNNNSKITTDDDITKQATVKATVALVTGKNIATKDDRKSQTSSSKVSDYSSDLDSESEIGSPRAAGETPSAEEKARLESERAKLEAEKAAKVAQLTPEQLAIEKSQKDARTRSKRLSDISNLEIMTNKPYVIPNELPDAVVKINAELDKEKNDFKLDTVRLKLDTLLLKTEENANKETDFNLQAITAKSSKILSAAAGTQNPDAVIKIFSFLASKDINYFSGTAGDALYENFETYFDKPESKTKDGIYKAFVGMIVNANKDPNEDDGLNNDEVTKVTDALLAPNHIDFGNIQGMFDNINNKINEEYGQRS